MPSALFDPSTFVAPVLALSISVERIVELAKQLLIGVPGIKWVFTQSDNPVRESSRCAVLHLISAIIGSFLAHYAGIKILNLEERWSWIIAGLLSSGGSAFWNHASDFVKAAKVQKEQTAKLAVAATRENPAAMSVRV